MLNFMLAELPEPGSYVSLVKVGVVLAIFVGWAFGCQWVDRDAELVKTRRERWNIIVYGAGILGLIILILPPWRGPAFFFGLAIWVLAAGGGQLVYVVHRNGRVLPGHRVLTVGHLKRVIARDPAAGASKLERGQRIHLANHEGKVAARPVDRDEAAQFDAAQDFLFDLLWRRASDAEILVGKDQARVIYRIDGVTAEQSAALSVADAPAVLQQLKKLAGLNPEEIRRPQEGGLSASLLSEVGAKGKITVVTSGSTTGERVRLTVHQPASRKRLHELGMATSRLEQVREAIRAHTGLMVVSGIRAGGVTTTLYGVLREHDAFIQNIHALEKRVLHDLDNITQAKFDPGEDQVSYARQLQSVLRREPDIVGVGECDDRETAQIALRAAGDNRKIYLGMDAKSSMDALARLIALAEDPKLVAKGLLAVVNQRLVRVLCTSCRQTFKPNEALLRKANIPPDKVEHFYRPPTEPVLDRKGREIICQTCQGSGYVGRVGIFEVFLVDDAIRQLITAGAEIKQIKSQARKNRMYNLEEEGLLKVIDGTTSLDEVIRVLRDEKK
ncbi:MAG: Flp pilus assembly complex ATPase component TadA [Phycisphaerales bacterium]|nr:Flp pilus assembly complex ATPase component TadA [Phycisphaerales bacterium]